MAVDLTSLYKQKRALEVEIEKAQAEARANGEVIIIDGKEYDSTMDFEGMLPNPVDTDFFPTYRKDENGDISDTGEITYADLIARFGQGVTDSKQDAIDAINDHVSSVITEQINPKVEAVEEIKTEVEGIQTEINSKVDGFTSTVEEAETSIATGKEDALNAIESAENDATAAINGMKHPGYREVIGDGTTKLFTIKHNLNCEWVVTQIWYPDETKHYPYILKEVDNNTLEISFYLAPEAGTEVRIISNERVSTSELPSDFKITTANLGPDVVLSQSEITQIISAAEV